MPEVGALKADPSTKSGSPQSSGKKSSGIKSVFRAVVPIIALVGLGTFFLKNGEQVSGIAAEAGLSGYALPIASGTPGVRVTWDKNKLSRGLNVVEYHIWRDDLPGPVQIGVPIEGVAYDDANGRTITAQAADPETKEKTSVTTTVPALDLGRPHKYYVSALYAVQSVSAPQYFETPRKAAGQATPIAQIPAANLRLPISGSQQNLHNVTFEWLSRRGADIYTVEASTDPMFRNPEYISNTVTYSAASDGQPIRLQVSEALYSLNQAQMHISSDTPIWWRVGARSSSDSPGPIPADGRSSMRYIYSEASRFYPVEMPPSIP
jgi:hypothetical protein